MGMFVGLVLAAISLVPTFLISNWLDRVVSTEVGGIFRLVCIIMIPALIVYLIGPENIDAFSSK
jgi:hypothetical protein